MGVLVSAMQSRELGWGMTLTNDQLKEIHSKRATDVNCFYEVVAPDVLVTTNKGTLAGSPFLRLLEYGQKRDGYWTGNDMIVQLKD